MTKILRLMEIVEMKKSGVRGNIFCLGYSFKSKNWCNKAA